MAGTKTINQISGIVFDDPRGLRNLEAAMALFWSAWELKESYLRGENPG